MMSDYELDVLENILLEQKKTNNLLKELISQSKELISQSKELISQSKELISQSKELVKLKRRDSDPNDISDLIHTPCKKMSDGSYGL